MPQSALLRPNELVMRDRPKRCRGKFFVQTWGCQMNEEDSEQIEIGLRGIGLEPAGSLIEAQIVVLNTCSVRKKPEDKAFSFLGELRLLKQSRSDLVVGVAGCMAQIRADEIRARNPHVDFVVGTAHVGAIPGLVEEAMQARRFQKRLQLPERKGALVDDVPQRLLGRPGRLKAFVPIQYGCDKFCTFCIVPSTRGRERSRPAEHIVEEVAALAKRGTKEVTLLGQTVNSYGKNLTGGKMPFADLLRRVADVSGIERIRYTSPYPRDFRKDLIETIRDVPAVMEHCHMPLQAGHDGLLKRMKRLYTVESFAEIVNDLRATVPRIGLTTDIIVGFPGETGEEFDATMAAVERFRFDGAFMFKYSPRPGTPAAELPQVPYDLASKRLNTLIHRQRQIQLEINESLVGSEFPVLVEGPTPKDSNLLQGYSPCFRMMHFAGPHSLSGVTVTVRATKAHLWGLAGTIVS